MRSPNLRLETTQIVNRSRVVKPTRIVALVREIFSNIRVVTACETSPSGEAAPS